MGREIPARLEEQLNHMDWSYLEMLDQREQKRGEFAPLGAMELPEIEGKKADFKAETSSIPVITSLDIKLDDVKAPEIKPVEIKVPEVKPVVEKKEEPKVEDASSMEKTGIFEILRKDKKVKKSDVELVVKEVAKEIHTTQQLKLKEIEAANEAANEAAKKKLSETKKLVLPEKDKNVQLKSKIDAVTEVVDLPPVKPVEITRVNRQQATSEIYMSALITLSLSSHTKNMCLLFSHSRIYTQRSLNQVLTTVKFYILII